MGGIHTYLRMQQQLYCRATDDEGHNHKVSAKYLRGRHMRTHKCIRTCIGIFMYIYIHTYIIYIYLHIYV